MTTVVVQADGERERRRAIEAVLRPCRPVTYPHVDRAIYLALNHGWNVKSASLKDACAIRSTRTIYVPPIAGDVELATFAHEGGHIEEPSLEEIGIVSTEDRGGQRFLYSLASEIFSFRFAIRTLGFRWNATMQAYAEECLRTYHARCVQTYQDLLEMEAVIAEGQEAARRVVRIR